MSCLARVLLPCLALLAWPCRALPLRNNMLKESIRLLHRLQQTQVSCNGMNVTDIFADYKPGDTTEVLCKAATVAWEGRSCHGHLEGVYVNLLGLLREHRLEHRAPCPVPAGSTTSLKSFLEELRQVLQKQYKNQE